MAIKNVLQCMSSLKTYMALYISAAPMVAFSSEHEYQLFKIVSLKTMDSSRSNGKQV